MKKILLVFFILLISNIVDISYAQHPLFEAVPVPTTETINTVPDGWYEAVVQYSSHTGQKSTYTLNVKVERLVVVVIDFGNGGYVHKGRNNSGYDYVGGGLNFHRDYYGNIVAASTTVNIYYDNGGRQKFEIYLQ